MNLTDIRETSQNIIDHKSAANCFVDLIILLENDCPKIFVAATDACSKVCLHFISSGQFIKKSYFNPEEEASAEYKYDCWLKDRYKDVCKSLCSKFQHDSFSFREISLIIMMKFLKAEGAVSNNLFPLPLLTVILNSLLLAIYQEYLKKETGENKSPSLSNVKLIEKFAEYLKYDDVRYYTMKFLHNFIEKISPSEVNESSNNELCLERLFHLIKNLNMTSEEPLERIFALTSTNIVEEKFKYKSLKEQKILFSNVWLGFLKINLPIKLYKSVLLILHIKVIPFMSNPRLLTDFLTLSYEKGGSISLLALNGLFVLINSFNLNYPDFYGKLYSLLQPSVFRIKYRARFMYHLDLFLSSTHLSANLVGSFIKRLSRLCLTCPPNALNSLIPLVTNLLIRHPNCQILINKPDAPKGLIEDPFLSNETDPNRTNALDSSLWEIKSLTEHYHHSVATQAKKLENKLPKMEIPFSDFLENSFSDLLEGERRSKKMKIVPMNYLSPKSIIHPSLSDLWTII